MLDAPVSGGEAGAINATLSIMVGGKPEVFERCRPLFEALGKSITYCGPSGAGQTVKLCNQVLVSVTNLAVCEALVLAEKAGVSPATMVEAVRAAPRPPGSYRTWRRRWSRATSAPASRSGTSRRTCASPWRSRATPRCRCRRRRW